MPYPSPFNYSQDATWAPDQNSLFAGITGMGQALSALPQTIAGSVSGIDQTLGKTLSDEISQALATLNQSAGQEKGPQQALEMSSIFNVGFT